MITNTKLSERLDDRGVSPVIGVILMVAITVILAAVIGAFVMDLGGNVSQNPQVGMSYNPTDNTVTINSAPRVDSVTVDFDGTTQTDSSVAAGDTITAADGSFTGTVTVTATYDGTTTVVAQYEDNSA